MPTDLIKSLDAIVKQRMCCMINVVNNFPNAGRGDYKYFFLSEHSSECVIENELRSQTETKKERELRCWVEKGEEDNAQATVARLFQFCAIAQTVSLKRH